MLLLWSIKRLGWRGIEKRRLMFQMTIQQGVMSVVLPRLRCGYWTEGLSTYIIMQTIYQIAGYNFIFYRQTYAKVLTPVSVFWRWQWCGGKDLWIPVMLRLNDLSFKYRELEVSVRRRSTTYIYFFSCLYSYYFFKFISLSRINHRNKIAFTFINFLVFARERNNFFLSLFLL